MTMVGDLANKLANAGRASEIERELEKLDPAKLTAAEREEWWHIYGLTAFGDGRDDVALERFKQGYDQFPGSPMIRFSLGQQYIRVQEPDKGFALFRETTFPAIPQRHALVEARYAYLYSRYEDARAFIRPFFEEYKNLRILDDNFLYVRGLPFFGSYWHHLAAFSVLSGDWAELDEVTGYVSKNCSDFDFDSLQMERDAYRNKDAGRLLATLTKRLEETKAVPVYPTGFTWMTIATIEARQAPTLATARDILENVTLTENDFHWLQDVRTLSMAEATRRFGDVVAERNAVAAFLKRQPLLFEPDIALEFWLLDAQERLKAELFQS